MNFLSEDHSLPSPDLTDGFVEMFEKYKKKIFCDILGKDTGCRVSCRFLMVEWDWVIWNGFASAFAASNISHYWATVGAEGFDMTNVLADLDTVESKHLIAFRESFRFFYQRDPVRFHDVDTFIKVFY